MTVDIRGIPDDLSLDTDHNGWTDKANLCVLLKAAVLGAMYIEAADKAVLYAQSLETELTNLREQWAKHAVRGGEANGTTAAALQRNLGDLLNVSVTQYPMALRLSHLNLAIDELSRRCDAPWDEVEDTFAFTIGQGVYDLKTLLGATAPIMSHPLLFSYVLTSGDVVRLDPLKPQEFLDTWPPGTANAPPEHFSLWNDDLWVGPPPDSTYTLTLRYRGKPVPLAAAADHNGWTDNAAALVLARAAMEACPYLGIPRRQEFEDQVEKQISTYVTEWSQRHRTARDIQTIEPGGGW